MVLRPGCSSLTMRRAIKSERLMRFRRGRCPRTRTQHGDITRMAQKCERPPLAWTKPARIFTSLMTTPPCRAGSREWRSSSVSVVFCRSEGFLHSAKVSSAWLGRQTAVAVGFYSRSLISCRKSRSSKNSSRREVTCVTFIPNIIASSISLSNIGAVPN